MGVKRTYLNALSCGKKNATINQLERMQLRHNVVTGRTEYRLPSTYGREGTEWTPVTDRVVNSLWTELSATKTVRAPLESS